MIIIIIIIIIIDYCDIESIIQAVLYLMYNPNEEDPVVELTFPHYTEEGLTLQQAVNLTKRGNAELLAQTWWSNIYIMVNLD